ncbi:MAG: hypothetical protein ACP5I1_11640, partial [Candidatus Hinthialibacter sp.]
MIDPLKNFNWENLYAKYDILANTAKFANNAPRFISFENIPLTDRDLYYKIINKIKEERESNSLMTINCYEAIMFWKLQSTSIQRNIEIKNKLDLR